MLKFTEFVLWKLGLIQAWEEAMSSDDCELGRAGARGLCPDRSLTESRGRLQLSLHPSRRWLQRGIARSAAIRASVGVASSGAEVTWMASHDLHLSLAEAKQLSVLFMNINSTPSCLKSP